MTGEFHLLIPEVRREDLYHVVQLKRGRQLTGDVGGFGKALRGSYGILRAWEDSAPRLY